jgi:hypothetical protein
MRGCLWRASMLHRRTLGEPVANASRRRRQISTARFISEEIYGDLSYRDPWRPVRHGNFVSLSSSGLIDDRLVVLGSLSKSHAMTGWRMGRPSVPVLHPRLHRSKPASVMVTRRWCAGTPSLLIAPPGRSRAAKELIDSGAASRIQRSVCFNIRDVPADHMGPALRCPAIRVSMPVLIQRLKGGIHEPPTPGD